MSAAHGTANGRTGASPEQAAADCTLARVVGVCTARQRQHDPAAMKPGPIDRFIIWILVDFQSR
jgi:hypothetical protein